MKRDVDDIDKLAGIEGPTTINQFRERHKVSRNTADRWIKDLLDRGLVKYVGRAPSSGGNRPALYDLDDISEA